MVTKKDDYNNVPVEYCKICLSLKSLTLSYNNTVKSNIAYCGDCGNSEIDVCHIEEHQKKYFEKYGKEYGENKSYL